MQSFLLLVAKDLKIRSKCFTKTGLDFLQDGMAAACMSCYAIAFSNISMLI
jgi:hypothetical protein